MRIVGIISLIDIMKPMKSAADVMLRRLATRGRSTVRIKMGCVAGGLLSARHSLSVILQFELERIGRGSFQKVNIGWLSIGTFYQPPPPDGNHPFACQIKYAHSQYRLADFAADTEDRQPTAEIR